MQKFTNENGAEVFVMGPEEVAGFVAEVTRARDEAAITPRDPEVVEATKLYRVTWHYGRGRAYEEMTASRPFTWAEVEHELSFDEGPGQRTTTWEEWS